MRKSLIVLISLISMGAAVAPLSAEMLVKNKALTWSTSAGQSGSMTISAVNGQYFEADQINENNKGAGTLKLYGAVVDGGKKIVMINTSKWKEVWEGAVSANEISGTLSSGSAKYTFKITEPVVIQSVASAPFAAGEYQGVHKDWTDKVIFSADGTYKRAVNSDPGTYTFDGKTLVLKWKKWNAETLVQTAPGQFTCKEYKFTLTALSAASTVSTDPFVNGAVLKWSSSLGQNGTMKVTSVSGTHFTLDQVNVKNAGAGIVKLEGEAKDGKIYIYNKKWNETWVGTVSGNTVKGKISGSIDFTISK